MSLQESPDYSGINSLNVGAFKNPWAAICDELVVGYGNAAKANNSDKNAATAGFHRYGDCYKYIRQANIFLEKAHVINNQRYARRQTGRRRTE